MMRKRLYCDEATDGVTRIRIFSWVLGFAVILLDALCAVEPAGRRSGRSHSAFARTQRDTSPERARVSAARRIARYLRRVTAAFSRATACAVRVIFYATQHRAARLRAVRSRSRSERAFGRESLLHCANILLRRKHKRLSPGTRAARRLVRSASRATERAVARGDMRPVDAATWLAGFASLAGVDLSSLKGRWFGRRKSSATTQPGTVIVGQEVRTPQGGGAVKSHFQTAPANAANAVAAGVAANDSPFDDEQMVVVRKVTEEEASREPAGFTIREDYVEEEDVLQYLARERQQPPHDERSPFDFDGD